MERSPGVPATFDVRTVVYLRRGANPPELSEEESAALHHAHLAHLAELWRRGIIAANAPDRLSGAGGPDGGTGPVRGPVALTRAVARGQRPASTWATMILTIIATG